MFDDFEMWMNEVDAVLIKRVGMDTGDLADYSFYDWFDDGITPAQAAQLVLEGEGF